MKRKSRRDWKIELAPPVLHNLAQQLVANHVELLLSDFRLMGSSTAWSTAPNQMSVRFVYRRRSTVAETVLTHVIHGVRLQ